MNKEEAKEKLRRAESDLRRAEIILEAYKNSIREMEEEIKELETIINKKDNWKDKLTKSDYVISGGLNGLEPWHGFNRLKAEHTFKTREQAQLLADKMNLMQQMHAFAHVRNEGWVPDWDNGDQKKWGIFYDALGRLQVYYNTWGNDFIFGLSVKSREIADEMAKEFGERIEKVYSKQY